MKYNLYIWYILISNRQYIWSNWAVKGIVQIHDIIKGNGDFLNHNEIKEKYDINGNFLNCLQIRHSLPMEWRQLIRNKPVKTKINEPFVSLGGRIVPFVISKQTHYINNLLNINTKNLQASQDGMPPQPSRFWMMNGQISFNDINHYERQKYNLCNSR